MKISDYENEAALDLLADIIEPAGEILADKEVKTAFESKNNFKAVSVMIRNHKKEVIEILARLDNTPVSEYKCNIFTLPIKLMEILNDKNLTSFFISQAQTKENNVSGSVTEITGETGTT